MKKPYTISIISEAKRFRNYALELTKMFEKYYKVDISPSKRLISIPELNILIRHLEGDYRSILGTYSDILYVDCEVYFVKGLTWNDLYFRCGSLRSISLDKVNYIREDVINYVKNNQEEIKETGNKSC